ncbi:hypothetical protein [Limnohabitans sp.]|jgi:hypothetical protein|uniref:hypothetical protein n=1 Tax=Limnohabitans sp. TaxID=1907725 RepID=UPI0037C1A3DF
MLESASPNGAAIWQGLDAEVLDFLKSAVQAMPDSDLVACAKKMPELMQGLRQDKPNTDLLRQRVLAKMQLKTLPPLILELLRSASLSESLVSVLSDKAIEQGLSALMSHFGRVPVLAAMWLDERGSVRSLAQACSEPGSPAHAKAKASKSKTEESFKQRFKPMLTLLQPVLADLPYELPTPRAHVRQLPAAASAQSPSREQVAREIRVSAPFKEVLRERNALQEERDGLLRLRDKLSHEVQAFGEQLKAARARLAEVEADWRLRVARGIADGLNKRMAPWLKASEALALPMADPADPLERARRTLARQSQEDLRFGTRSLVGEQLAEAQRLLAALRDAQLEALRPLPQLGQEQRALASHIEALQARLLQHSIQPRQQPVRQLAQALLAVHNMDELHETKRQVERSMLAEAWSMAMCQQAYEVLDRRAMQIYELHHSGAQAHKDEHPPVTPKQHFEHGLRQALPMRLIIDGHNLLPKLKPLIGAAYFSEAQGPNARARALLIERVRWLTELHPLLCADIVFDGPDDQHWSETESLRVCFSGGQGSDRADGRILELLQAQRYQDQGELRAAALCFVATEDRDLRLQSQALKALVVSPLELWAMLD